MSQSRDDLLIWLNRDLQLNFTKIEQCGTGAAYCQIFDMIDKGVHMWKVNFSANTEYQYLQNFKVLQTELARLEINKIVPVEALIKCKMQDNLEFLQWSKRYWDQHSPWVGGATRDGEGYDPVERRSASKLGSGPMSSAGSARANAARRPAGDMTRGGARTKAPVSGRGGARTRAPLSGRGGAGNAALQQELGVLRETVTGLERERDFYFSKLRDIELLIQQAVEADPELDNDDNILKQIQGILYSTEEGFEIPAEAEAEEVEEETF